MTNIGTILTAAVTSLKVLEDLVNLVTDADFISAYTDSNSEFKNLQDAVNSMQVPSILVAHEDTELSADGGSDFPRWCHKFSIFFRFERTSEAWAALEVLLNGCWISQDLMNGIWSPSDFVVDKVTNSDDVELYRLSFRVFEA